jgi:amino acid adenylation domain-containing protein
MRAADACLHELIEAQARRTPDAVALAFEGRRLTYGELDRRASRLAQHLGTLEVGPDVLVGLLVERSLEMVVGILGVLKAGGAYVPMDSSFPEERVAFMCADAKVRLLLTQASLSAKLPSVAAQVVRLDEFDWNGSEAGTPGDARAHPDHLAYVIYTSGSTGRPKGVCIEHRNIVNYVLGVAERLQLEAAMNHAMVSTIAADLGNTVLFPALATGGCLHLISQERAQSQAMLSDYFSREKIDVLKIVPSHLAALQSGRNPQQVMPASRLILGGESSRLDWIERLRALSPQCEIYNHYGPTEATVGVLTYHVGAQLPSTRSGTLPLGRPLPNSRVYLLDRHGQPVPIGEPGELCIGGGGVARGYFDRPDLTAEKFVADPFSTDPGARLYRTGDLARCLAEGAIDLCGRIDHTVKLHGYRVELGEIEGALREQGGVQDAVVLVREGDSRDKQLVAYVAPERTNRLPYVQEQTLTPTMLREYLKGRLPQYMVPSAFVLMERLPLTANGKIDRQALAALSFENMEPAQDFVGPRTETEKALAVIWTRLLKAENIGINDDVFDLGAHSLLAMKALTQIRDVFEVSLTLRNLFEHPTIAGLAEIIDGLWWLAKAKTPSEDTGDREEIVL